MDVSLKRAHAVVQRLFDGRLHSLPHLCQLEWREGYHCVREGGGRRRERKGEEDRGRGREEGRAKAGEGGRERE